MNFLDTHLLIWWTTQNRRLAARHRALLDAATPDAPVSVSDVSIAEIGELCRRGRMPRIGLQRLRGYVRDLEAGPIAYLGVTRSVAVEAAMLPDTIRDPFDRLISATARVHGATLLTDDRAILDSGCVATC